MNRNNNINGSRVKCFPNAMVIDGEKYSGDKKVEVNNLHGTSGNYFIGSILPYETPIYNYGKDFIILDYIGDEDDNGKNKNHIHVIKNGIVVMSTDVAYHIPEITGMVISHLGEILNVKSKEDVIAIIKNHEEKRSMISVMVKEKKSEIMVDKLSKQEFMNIFNQAANKFKETWISRKTAFSNEIGYFVDEIIENKTNVQILWDEFKTENDAKKLIEEYNVWSNNKYSKIISDNLKI